MTTHVLVTADDFGLSERINDGILHGHLRGSVRSAALLVAGPATAQAVSLARRHPSLEVGLHLAFVESFASTGLENSLTTSERYFAGGPCLHRDWKTFLRRFVSGRIRRSELEAELENQFQIFRRHFDSIPFVNSTQHLHLFPVLDRIVLKLCRKFGVRSVRILRDPAPRGERRLQSRIVSFLGARLARRARKMGFQVADFGLGFDRAGSIDRGDIARYLAIGRGATLEIVGHPGFDDPSLLSLYPGSFDGFCWERELSAFCSQELRVPGVKTIQFTDLGQV